jgi:hypothetical protein
MIPSQAVDTIIGNAMASISATPPLPSVIVKYFFNAVHHLKSRKMAKDPYAATGRFTAIFSGVQK